MRPRFVVPILFAAILSACAGTGATTSKAVDARAQIAPQAQPAMTRQQLAERRAVAIARLREYRLAGTFPKNRISDDRINVFIDEDGHLCAAANLMALDGKLDLVRATARQNNTIRLADVKDGELMAWMLTSGLTQEEIALIQEPYEPAMPSAGFEQQERERLQQHFLMVEQQLERDTDKSLDVAMSRLPSAA